MTLRAPIPHLPAILLAAAPLLAAGCTTAPGDRAAADGACPEGERCTWETPYGLHFQGRPLVDVVLDLDGPYPTAVGGTQRIGLLFQPSPGATLQMLAEPFTIDDTGGAGVAFVGAGAQAHEIDLAGVAPTTNYVRVLEPDTGELYDRKRLGAAEIARVEVLAGTGERLPPSRPPIAFTPGELIVGVGLWGVDPEASTPSPTRLVDDGLSMTLGLPGATFAAWDARHVPAAGVGTYGLDVVAGGQPYALPVVVVDGADEIVRHPDAGEDPGLLCFGAYRAGRFVTGLGWEFEVGGERRVSRAGQVWGNCTGVDGAAGARIPVVVRAGGAELRTTYVVAAARTAAAPDAPSRTVRTPAGERAAR